MADETIEGLPVAGYRPQSAMAVELVNGFKEIEERVLRSIDALEQSNAAHFKDQRAQGTAALSIPYKDPGPPPYDPRMLVLARTKFQEGFMWLNRSVFQPTRISLPEDEA